MFCLAFRLLAFVGVVAGIFEYICEEEHLFKPYLHVYRGRKGERILVAETPGFYVMSQESNIYVCINGPAYLYFSKTTNLGQVYEAPIDRIYAHTCEMHNIKPHSKATKLDYELHLMAVLLYGDEDDYRKPSIQPFVAPYYFEENEYLQGFPRHYQNATSVAIIGRDKTECSLIKGSKDPKLSINFRLPTPPSPQPPPSEVVPPTPVPGEKQEFDEQLCKLGFSELLIASAGKTDDTDEKKKMRAMVNDEVISSGGCSPLSLSSADVEAKNKEIFEVWKKANDAFDTQDWAALYKDKVKDAKAVWEAKKKDAEGKLNPTAPASKPSPGEQRRLQAVVKKMDEALAAEDTKEAAFIKIHESASKKIKAVTPTDPIDSSSKLGTAKDAANSAHEAYNQALDELKDKTAAGDIPGIEAAKVKLYYGTTGKDGAEETARSKALEATKELSDLEVGVLEAQIEVDTMTRLFDSFKPGAPPPSKKTQTRLVYSSRSPPVTIDVSPGDGTTPTLGSCTLLPKLKGEEGECKKGKPDGVKSCLLLAAVEGTSSWDSAAKDFWKKEILDLLGEIFIITCPNLSNRRNFVDKIKLLMSYYLTSSDHYNQELDDPDTKITGTSKACIAFRDWKLGQNPDPNATPKPPPDPDKNKDRRFFWEEIYPDLIACRDNATALVFRTVPGSYGAWEWLKDESSEGIEIENYKEQAEEEYVFNWVIDMCWRIFATTLGVCIPSSLQSNPLKISAFYSLFTEDFLIPLRETWVNAKDNLVFQWILGEFYNGDAEEWAERCMEASYHAAESEDYRPPRGLLVNCESEHNYFTTGKFAGTTGRFAH